MMTLHHLLVLEAQTAQIQEVPSPQRRNEKPYSLVWRKAAVGMGVSRLYLLIPQPRWRLPRERVGYFGDRVVGTVALVLGLWRTVMESLSRMWLKMTSRGGLENGKRDKPAVGIWRVGFEFWGFCFCGSVNNNALMTKFLYFNLLWSLPSHASEALLRDKMNLTKWEEHVLKIFGTTINLSRMMLLTCTVAPGRSTSCRQRQERRDDVVINSFVLPESIFHNGIFQVSEKQKGHLRHIRPHIPVDTHPEKCFEQHQRVGLHFGYSFHNQTKSNEVIYYDYKITRKVYTK